MNFDGGMPDGLEMSTDDRTWDSLKRRRLVEWSCYGPRASKKGLRLLARTFLRPKAFDTSDVLREKGFSIYRNRNGELVLKTADVT